MEIEKVKIKRVVGPTPSGAAVLLGNEKKTFVVFVGFYEAAALVREINNEAPPRPLTHELIQSVFIGFDLEVKQIIVSSIIENTFCATLILQQKIPSPGGEDWTAKRNEVRIDARPSDCLVLALKNKADIYVTKEVFDQVQDVSKMTATSGDSSLSQEALEFELNPSLSGLSESPGTVPGASEDGELDDVFGFGEDDDEEDDED